MKNALIFIAMLIMFLILVVGIIATISHNFKNPIFTETDTSTFRTTTSTTTVHTTTSTSLTTTSTSTSSLTYITSSFSSTTICPQGIICSRSVNVIALYTPYVPLVIQTNPGYAAATGWGTCIKYNYQGVESPQICTGAKPEGDGSSVAEEMVPYNSIINYLCTAAWYPPTPYGFVNWTGSFNGANDCYSSNLLTVTNPVTIVANYQPVQTTTTTIIYQSYNAVQCYAKCNVTIKFHEYGLPSGSKWSIQGFGDPQRSLQGIVGQNNNTLTFRNVWIYVGYDGYSGTWYDDMASWTWNTPGYSSPEAWATLNVISNATIPIYFFPCGPTAPPNVFTWPLNYSVPTNYTRLQVLNNRDCYYPFDLVPVIFNYTSPLHSGQTWSLTFNNTVTYTTSNKIIVVNLLPRQYTNVYATKPNGTRTAPVTINVSTAGVIASGGFGGDYYVDAITPAKCSNGALYPPACNYFAPSSDNSIQAEITSIINEIFTNVRNVFK